MSIIAIVLSVLSLLWTTVLLFVFWKQVCIFLYDVSAEVIAEGPMLPIGNTVYMFGCTAIIVAAYILSKHSRTITGEIVLVALLSFVLPVVTYCLSIAQTQEIASSDFRSYSAIAALNIANNISSFARSFMNVAAALCYVVCGISISEKMHLKKTTLNSTQTKE